MTLRMMILFPAALIGTLPLMALAETMDQTEVDLFHTATVSLTQAGETALKAHDGTLAAISFGDEDGRAAYEAVVIGADGQPWTVLVDAKSGEVFASAISSAMNDHEDGKKGHEEGDDDGDGETNDG